MKEEIKEILELTIQFVEEELDKGTPKKDIIKEYSTQVGEAFNHIKHYITNLQEENEMLNNECDTYMKIATKKQKRIDKAIEYINHAQNYGTMAQVMPHLKPYVNGDDLLNILQGEDTKESEVK